MSRRNHQQIQDSSEEAEEANESLQLESPSQHPSEEEGEDLLEHPERDYQSIYVPPPPARYLTTTKGKASTMRTTTSTPRPVEPRKRSWS